MTSMQHSDLNRVDLVPIREAFARSVFGHHPHGVAQVAHAMQMDPEYMRRLLGRKLDARTVRYTDGRVVRKPYALLTCSEGTAMKFAAVLGLDPVDLGF
jgi:hypothetical protein